MKQSAREQHCGARCASRAFVHHLAYDALNINVFAHAPRARLPLPLRDFDCIATVGGEGVCPHVLRARVRGREGRWSSGKRGNDPSLPPAAAE